MLTELVSVLSENPPLTGDPKQDVVILKKSLDNLLNVFLDFRHRLNEPNSLHITQASIENAIIENSTIGLTTPGEGAFTVLTATYVGADHAFFGNVAYPYAVELDGSILVYGAARRFLADFSNATGSSRFSFQTSAVNNATNVGALPSGSGVAASFTAYGSSDVANAPFTEFLQFNSDTWIRNGANGSGAGGNIVFFTEGTTERLRISKTTGNVGIGKTPVQRLSVGDGAGFEAIEIDGGASGAGAGPSLNFSYGGVATQAIGAYSAISGGAFDSRLTFYSGGDLVFCSFSLTPKLTLSTTGDVTLATGKLGIGVTPSYRLSINGAGGVDSGFQTANTNATETMRWGVMAPTDGADAYRSSILFKTAAGGSGSDSSIEFETNQYGASRATRMTISKTGDVTLATGKLIHAAPTNLKGYTVATLPAGTVGDLAYCTDLLAPGFLVAAVGGGAVVGPVFRNATVWVAV